MLDKGVVTVTASPGVQGDTARLECTPASSYYTLTNVTKSRTTSAGPFRVSRNWLENSNDITVSGNVDGRRIGAVNIYSSQDFFMHTFWNVCGQKASAVCRTILSASSKKIVFLCEWHTIILLCRQ